MPKLICHGNSVFKCNHIVEDFEKKHSANSTFVCIDFCSPKKGLLDAQSKGNNHKGCFKNRNGGHHHNGSGQASLAKTDQM